MNAIELYPLGKIKDRIKTMFLNDEDICTLLVNKNDPETAALHDNLFISETQSDVRTYIVMDTFVSNCESLKIKEVQTTIQVFTHNTLIALPNGEMPKYQAKGYFGNRIDILCDAIARCLNGSLEFGIGSMQLVQRSPIRLIQPNSNYYGTFEVSI